MFGISDSVTKFTGSIGKGLSAATLDAEFQSKRRMTQRRNKPKHALYGVAAGASAFADSVTSAFEGVAVSGIIKPKNQSTLAMLTAWTYSQSPWKALKKEALQDSPRVWVKVSSAFSRSPLLA